MGIINIIVAKAAGAKLKSEAREASRALTGTPDVQPWETTPLRNKDVFGPGSNVNTDAVLSKDGIISLIDPLRIKIKHTQCETCFTLGLSYADFIACYQNPACQDPPPPPITPELQNPQAGPAQTDSVTHSLVPNTLYEIAYERTLLGGYPNPLNITYRYLAQPGDYFFEQSDYTSPVGNSYGVPYTTNTGGLAWQYSHGVGIFNNGSVCVTSTTDPPLKGGPSDLSWITESSWGIFGGNFIDFGEIFQYNGTIITHYDQKAMISVQTLGGNDFQNPPNPPPFYNSGDDEIMGCCDDILYAIAKLQKSVDIITEVVAPDEFHDCVIPKRWLYPEAHGHQQIKNYPQLIEGIYRFIDRVVGYWPAQVALDDKNGKKQSVAHIHSIADFLKEIIEIEKAIYSKEALELKELIKITLSTLYEAGDTHQIATKTYYLADAIAEYLDFKQDQKTVNMPMAFDPTARGGKVAKGFGKNVAAPPPIPDYNAAEETLLKKILVPTQMPIRVSEHSDKQTQNERLLEILRYAAIAASAVSKPISSIEGIAGLVAAAATQEQLSRFLNRKDMTDVLLREVSIGDLDTFLAQEQSGYTEKAPDQTLGTADKPFGKYPTQEPQVKRVSKKRKR